MKNIDIVKTNDLYTTYKSKTNRQIPMQHYHDSYEIVFFISGSLEVFIKDTRYEIHDGGIIFINEFDIHRFIYKDAPVSRNRYLLNFKKDYILPNLKAAGIDSILEDLKNSAYTLTTTTLKEKYELESLFKAIITMQASYSNSIPAPIQEAALKSCLMLILIKIWQLIKNRNPQDSINKKGKFVQEIIRFIDNNYMNPISLKLLEEEFHMNQFHIGHIFKEITDFSVIEYVQQRRIMESQKMLTETENEITGICFDCGFNTIQHFHRVFKKISGMTPDKYRKEFFKKTIDK